jgi:hypothetical protein
MHKAPLSFLIYLLYFKNSQLLNRCELDPCVYDVFDSEAALELNPEVVMLTAGTPCRVVLHSEKDHKVSETGTFTVFIVGDGKASTHRQLVKRERTIPGTCPVPDSLETVFVACLCVIQLNFTAFFRFPVVSGTQLQARSQ